LSKLPAQRAAAVTQLASERWTAAVVELVVDPQIAPTAMDAIELKRPETAEFEVGTAK
jgi:hypothetical protein